MTIKQTYEFLLSIKKLEAKIQNMMLQCEALRSCLLPSGIRYDLDKIQTTASDHMSDIEARVLDMEKEILSMQQEKTQLIIDISAAINQLPEQAEQTVLISYYITRKSMEQVADLAGYSLSHAYRIKRNAIKHLARLVER